MWIASIIHGHPSAWQAWHAFAFVVLVGDFVVFVAFAFVGDLGFGDAFAFEVIDFPTPPSA